MNKLFLVLVTVVIAGCAPRLQFSTPRTVMMSNVDQFNATEALQIAEAECMKHNRHAVAV